MQSKLNDLPSTHNSNLDLDSVFLKYRGNIYSRQFTQHPEIPRVTATLKYRGSVYNREFSQQIKTKKIVTLKYRGNVYNRQISQ